MFISSFKRHVLVSMICLFAGAGLGGCVSAPEDAVENEELGEAQQALPNCVATCVQIYKVCIQYDDPVACAADREACKEECYADTCEPGEPDCCQGQPTCY